MKKLLTDWEWLSIRVLLLGFTVFMWSFITEIEGVRELFGDAIRTSGLHEGDYMWGFRHFIYTFTFLIITIIQAFRIIK